MSDLTDFLSFNESVKESESESEGQREEGVTQGEVEMVAAVPESAKAARRRFLVEQRAARAAAVRQVKVSEASTGSGKRRDEHEIAPLSTVAAAVHAPLPADVTATMRLARASVYVAKKTEEDARDPERPALFATASQVPVRGVGVNDRVYVERAPTAPATHFSLPGTFVTDDVARDMETLALRDHIDPSRRYKSGGKETQPLAERWFQLGTVVGDASRARQPRGSRAPSLADELLAGASGKVKKRYAASKPKRRKIKRG
jgi:hypothetical protein